MSCRTRCLQRLLHPADHQLYYLGLYSFVQNLSKWDVQAIPDLPLRDNIYSILLWVAGRIRTEVSSGHGKEYKDRELARLLALILPMPAAPSSTNVGYHCLNRLGKKTIKFVSQGNGHACSHVGLLAA